MKIKPQILLIAGPHGVGKSYVARRLTQQSNLIEIAPGVVTRAPRASLNDNDKQVTIEEFQKMARAGLLCLEKKIGDHYYGYVRQGIDDNIKADKCVIILLLFADDVSQASALWPHLSSFYLRSVDTKLLRDRLVARDGVGDSRIESLISEGARAVRELDKLDWTARLDVTEDTDAAGKILDFLTTA